MPAACGASLHGATVGCQWVRDSPAYLPCQRGPPTPVRLPMTARRRPRKNDASALPQIASRRHPSTAPAISARELGQKLRLQLGAGGGARARQARRHHAQSPGGPAAAAAHGAAAAAAAAAAAIRAASTPGSQRRQLAPHEDALARTRLAGDERRRACLEAGTH